MSPTRRPRYAGAVYLVSRKAMSVNTTYLPFCVSSHRHMSQSEYSWTSEVRQGQFLM